MPLPRLPPPLRRTLLLDVGIAVVVGIMSTIMIHEAVEPRSRPVDAQAYALGLAMTLPVLMHRRRSVAALLLCSLGLFVYYSADYPGISATTALAVPLYSAVLAGHLAWAIGVISVIFSAGYAIVVFAERVPALQSLAEFLTHGALAAVVILLAEVVRSRRALAAETRERLRLAEEDREREAARRVAEERVRIARDLHDTVAHSMATIAVQAGTALHVLDGRPDDARTALAAIRGTSKDALGELRATLGVLRDGAEPDDVAAGLDRLPALVDAVRAAGVPVDLGVTGTPGPPPAPVDQAAYRILQESLTNVLRHAGHGARATVRVSYGPDGLVLEIRDDGSGPKDGHGEGSGDGSGEGSGGHGIAGMRERAESLGGTFGAGAGPGGGFAVRAALPLGGPGEVR